MPRTFSHQTRHKMPNSPNWYEFVYFTDGTYVRHEVTPEGFQVGIEALVVDERQELWDRMTAERQLLIAA